jgi:hypothetical protein
MKLPYGISAYQRTRGNLPSLELVNMFVEQSNSQGVILQSRKALAQVADVGTGPVRATLAEDGVFSGDRFTLSGNNFYRGSTLLGTVSGSGVATIAANETEVLICAGEAIYSYNGTNFAKVTFPDSAAVCAIAYNAGYFFALRAGTGQWYFSAVEDGRTWDALDFATAENEPDQLLDLVFLDGVLILAGTNSIEFWGATGDADLPYSPIQQRVFEQGIIATGCIATVDNTFYWIGRDKITYRNGDVPQAIADDGIVEKAEDSDTFRLYVLEDERHKFLCQRHDANTMVYDVTTQQWCEFKSYGRDNFRAGPGFGDDTTGKIWSFSGYDEGPIERLFMAGSVLEQAVQIDNLRMVCEVGTTPNLTGDYAEPVIEMAYSDDAGNTFSDYEAESIGRQGQYRQRVEWRALGMFDDPGVLFKFRITDPVSFRVSGVGVNEATGGRSR